MSLIIFMRHGQAYNNVKKLLVGRNLESHLTDMGRNTSQKYQSNPDVH